MKLTVFYNGQFWVGVIEEPVDGRMKVARHVFGSEEPGNPEVQQFVLTDLLRRLDQTQTTVSAGEPALRRINPKRMARQVAREASQTGVSTRAQEALRLELEARKQDRKLLSREERDRQAAYKRELRIQKRREKHRGH